MQNIIAYWSKENPQVISLTEQSICPWLSANWVEKRPATPEEIEMYNNGKTIYLIKEQESCMQ